MKYKKPNRRIKDPCIKPTYLHDWQKDIKFDSYTTRYRCRRCLGHKFVTRMKRNEVQSTFDGDHKANQDFNRLGGGYRTKTLK